MTFILDKLAPPQSCERADKYSTETENISPNPKRDLKPKPSPKYQKVKLGLKKKYAANKTTYCWSNVTHL